jgi:hypothetical protein
MQQLSPRKLATKIAKESHGVVIRQGRTNGQDVLHLQRLRDEAKKVEAASLTIPAKLSEWTYHPWNALNAPKPKKESDES